MWDDKSNTTQAYNAGKYATGVAFGVCAAVYGITRDMRWFWAAVGVHSINTIYCSYWDIYMDWGLLRAKNGLRDKLTFHPSFYYIAIIEDLILRCTWLIAIFFSPDDHPVIATFTYSTVLAIAELVRRWVWAIIRIENEQVSNLEKYRYMLEVPELGSTEVQDRLAFLKTEQDYKNLVKTIL